jgi:hypothetical protein
MTQLSPVIFSLYNVPFPVILRLSGYFSAYLPATGYKFER